MDVSVEESLTLDPEIAAPVLLERAVQKMRAFNKDMDEGPYILLYPDCSEVVNVPGSEKPFTLAEYKKDLGKAYARITLFICLEKHFRGGDDTSNSDSEIVITSRSTAKFNQADTVVFEFEPRNKSTPKHKPENEGKALGHSSTTQHGQNLKDRPIFDGPDGHRFLVYNANAVREDEYYLAGKMIAVSVVHGGPGPHFLSEDLVRYLAGQPSFKATVNLITDEEVGKALEEIENAASVDALREMTMRHSTMLQTAGCLRHVASVEEKKGIVSDYLQWYIIGRNSSVIDRFKEGLSALQFLNALQQHPTLLAPVLCHSEKRLTALELERLFKPDLSPPGSNRRLGESQTLGYWADYLLDCEESQTAMSLEDVLMFATGLTSLPPSGFEPSPGIEFLDDSPFPMANTCSNTLKLPLLEAYNVFKSQMDFGMQNSLGFGCY
ncbi:hypothetical protein NQZ68_032262 [Dissostichus eleginoides]|nr:hypothetical protein NQZ68_032262 [Dissostichus eleginoides]